MNETQNKKKNKKLIILTLAAVALIAAVLVFVFILSNTDTPDTPINPDPSVEQTGDNNNPVNPNTTDTNPVGEQTGDNNNPVNPNTTDEDDNKNDNNKKVVGEVNAYDYIIEVMSEPQYWSEEEFFPVYSAPWDEEKARETLINASGWKLVDEETATFERGYKGVLTICFSNHTAVSKDVLAGTEFFMDFENDNYYMIYSDGTKEDYNIKKGTEFYWNGPYGLVDNTFRYYDAIFSEAGCPLLNEPVGTLGSYKNKKAQKVISESNIIESPWDVDGFSFDWETNKNINWLSDYKEIENKQVPSSELVSVNREDRNGNVSTVMYGKYSPLYLVLADKDSSATYHKQDGSVWFDSLAVCDNITESVAIYYLAPAMKELYGYDAVYFVDAKKLNGSHNAYSIDTKDEFENGIYYDYESYAQGILEIFPNGEMFSGMCYSDQFNNYDFVILMDNVKDLYEYYGKEYNYSDDYLAKLILVYSLEEQLFLGLR